MDLALKPKMRSQTIFEWLYIELRQSILERQIKPGMKLPSTRDLAKQYKISRGTVVSVYAQLLSEGYLNSKIGSGTFVSTELPDRELEILGNDTSPVKRPVGVNPGLSDFSKFYLNARIHGVFQNPAKAFRPHQGAHDLFPLQVWGRITSRLLRRMSPWSLGSMDPRGYLPLRKAISEHLISSRGVKCDADQIFIVSGLQQALDISVRAIINRGDIVWLEDPGYLGAYNTFLAAKAEVVSIPIDRQGINFSKSEQKKLPRIIYTTPAHQFPLGFAMSINRRLELLDFAGKNGIWIFEDDYDGEFRYRGRPLPALQSFDQNDLVLYASSFSKTLFTGIRLGYLVVPRKYVGLFCAIRSVVDRFPPIIEQAVLTEFINDGHYGHHLRKMRRIYGERHQELEVNIKRFLDGVISLESSDAGLQSIAWLPERYSDRKVAQLGNQLGLELLPVSTYARKSKIPPGLILGFAAISERQIRLGVESLAKIFR